jgi:glycosyltransferase involved in cell wall biosynthesis
MFGHFAPDYPRNRQVEETLTSLGLDVVLVQRSGPVLRRWPRLARDAHRQRFDALWVAFLGYSDVPLAWALSRWRRVPLVFDAFVLLHDTFVTDRETVRRRSPAAIFLRALEIVACHLADVVVVDTVDHAERVARRTRLDPARIRVLHVGSEQAEPCRDEARPEPFRVTFCGSFMPLHGADVIVRAAALLEGDPAIDFVLVGAGQTKSGVVALAHSLGCERVSFVDPCRGDALRTILCDAHVLLGVFGTSAKSTVVIPNKVVDALALGRPVITADTPAIRRLLDPTQIVTIPPGDPQALAAAISALSSDATRRARLAEAGRRAYEDLFSLAARRPEMTEIIDAATRSTRSVNRAW